MNDVKTELNRIMTEVDIPYAYGRWLTTPTAPYATGEVRCIETNFTTGKSVHAVYIYIVAKTFAELDTASEKIKQVFQNRHYARRGVGYAWEFISADATPSEHPELKRCMVRLTATKWAAIGE